MQQIECVKNKVSFDIGLTLLKFSYNMCGTENGSRFTKNFLESGFNLEGLSIVDERRRLLQAIAKRVQ